MTVLSNCGEYITLNTRKKDIGVFLSTIDAGDFRRQSSANAFSLGRKLSVMANKIGAKKFLHLIPDHKAFVMLTGDRIIESANTFYPADAIIHIDAVGRYLALIHCSYITLGKNIVEDSFSRLFRYTTIESDKIKAFIYGGICDNCYEVDSKVLNLFEHETDNLRFFKANGRKGHYMMDLAGLIKHKLIANGINSKAIQTAELCSVCTMLSRPNSKKTLNSRLFYSLRKYKDKERNLIFVKSPNSDTMFSGTTGNCPYVVIYKSTN